MTTATQETRREPRVIELFPKQEEFVFSKASFPAMIGGVGSGKTEGGSTKCLYVAGEYPGSLGMVTAPTFAMLRDATLRTIMKVIPEDLYEFTKSDMRISLKNGSEILLRSTDDPEHLRGPNLAYFYMDEAAQSPHDAFKILQGRLRQPGMPHQGWITTTPKGFNWVYQEFAKDHRDEYELHQVSSRDNPYLPTAFIETLEESYTDEFAMQEIEGRFVIIGGNIFFDRTRLEEMPDEVSEPRETRLGGVIKIWKKPTVAGRYVAGGDVAWGETGAYSCVTIIDHRTGDQVAEVYGRLKDDELAKATIELCREYNRAYLAVENNNEGINVVNRMIDLGYRDRMYFQDHLSDSPSKPGWHTNATTRPVMLGELEEALRNQQITVRCSDAVSEFQSFIRNEKGRPEAMEGTHDDHVISWAIAWQARATARFRTSPGGIVIPTRQW